MGKQKSKRKPLTIPPIQESGLVLVFYSLTRISMGLFSAYGSMSRSSHSSCMCEKSTGDHLIFISHDASVSRPHLGIFLRLSARSRCLHAGLFCSVSFFFFFNTTNTRSVIECEGCLQPLPPPNQPHMQKSWGQLWPEPEHAACGCTLRPGTGFEQGAQS